MVRILISYASFSGNTQETATLIEEQMKNVGWEVDMYRIRSQAVNLPDPSQYDGVLIGSFTWSKGKTPPIVKQFVYQIGYKPPKVYIFGTGDTQFGGDELFCKACDRLAKFYNSPLRPLKIEQSPRGPQEFQVMQWTEGVIKHCSNY